MNALEPWERLILLSLACWQAVEIWHHGEIFVGPREFFRQWPVSRYGLVRWFGKLINCMFCLSVWVAGMFVYDVQHHGDHPFVQFFIWTLAVTRLAQLGNDYFHDRGTRTPPGDLLVEREDLTLTDLPGDVTPGSSSTG